MQKITNNRKFKVMKDMESVNTVRTSTVMVSRWVRQWSRITLTRPLLTMLALLMVCLFGVNEKAWGYWTTDKDGNTIADNASIKGYVSYSGGIYYVIDESAEHSVFQTNSYYYYQLGPGSQIAFEACTQLAAAQNLKVNDGYTNVYDGYPGHFSWGSAKYDPYGPFDINTDSKSIRFYGSTAATLTRWFQNVKVTMGSYFVPEKTSVDFGEADVNTDNVSESFKIYWSNIAAQSITKTGNTDRFEVNVTSVPSQVGYYGNTVLTITYKHDVAGSHEMTLTVNGQDITVSGKTNKLDPTITWSSDAAYFNVDDVLSATNGNNLTVTLSSTGNEEYVQCEGNSATMLQATSGTIAIKAHVTGNNIYADKDFTKNITITNKEKQSITWTQDFSRLKTTDGTKSITLNATASSGQAVSYALVGDKTGLNLSKSGNTWTLTYSSECKNTTIVASQDGDATYAPASSVSKTVKVVDPTKVCDERETLVNTTVTMKNTSNTYNIDIPNKMYVSVSRTKSLLYTVGVDFEFYDDRNGTGTKLYTKPYGVTDLWNGITNSEIDLSSYIHAKSVKVVTTSTNGYDINGITYTHQKYCNLSTNSLDFATYPSTTTSAKKFTVNYANYPISLECSNDKFSFTPTSFGDCSEYGSQEISVTYTSGASEGNDVGYLYLKDNTGATLKTCTLNVSVNKVAQSITSHTIGTAYKTTDKVTLSAEANSKLTDFTYSASPAGVASFNGSEMTFLKSGTIAITVTQPGNNEYAATSATVQNVEVSKVAPTLTAPSAGTEIKYLQKLENSTIANDGEAKVTLRGVANTTVGGTFAWTNKDYQVVEAAGSHNYGVTFTPTDGGMYSAPTCVVPINIARATQAIEMNDGAVKVAVSGIDAGAADSKIDLDDLIKSQTVDPVEANRAGDVTYEVISANKATANIATGNIFSATAIGEYTIRATKAETDYYEAATDEFVVSVSKRANTMTIAGTEYERFVDEEVTDIRDVQNSDATVQTSSTNENLAYYDVANNKIVIPNSNNQMFGASTTVTIKIWQDQTPRFEALDTLTITLTVKKYVTAFSGKDYDMLVDGTQVGEYVFTNTSAEKPTANSADDFYYTFENTSFDNEALNSGNDLATFEPSNNLITAKNAGATKIAFYQKETRKHTGATATYRIAVAKYANAFSCVWNDESTDWTKLMNQNQSATVVITTNHSDYSHYPISIEQTYGDAIATMSGTAASATITSTNENGYAIWHLSQAENYKYYAAEADIVAAVGVEAPPTCYILEDYDEHNFYNDIYEFQGEYGSSIAITAPVDKIWFSAKRQTAGANYFVAQYSVDNGTSWRDICNPDLDTEYKDFGPYSFTGLKNNEYVTHIRFGAKTGATLRKWYKNIKVSRKSYINIQNAGKEKIASLALPTNTVGNTTTAKFYIDYSTCDGELTIASSDPHFTVNRSTVSVSGDNRDKAKEEIVVSYTSDAEGNHVGVITVSSSYQVAALSVSGVTNKRVQTIEWNAGFNTDPITLAVGTIVNDKNIAAVASSTNRVYYASDDESVIAIMNDGKEFAVVGEGTTTLTASAEGNAMWSDVSVTRTVVATEKDIQEIVWNQIFPRFMEIGSEVELDADVYIRHGDQRTYSEARSALITYSCPLNNGIISVSGNKMRILAYGETTVWADVAGNADYAAAARVKVAVNVRQPSQGCETPFVLNHEQTVTISLDFDWSDWKYPECNSEVITLDNTQGKPDKLSYLYKGEEVAVLGLAGNVNAQQRVDGVWTNLNNGAAADANEWRIVENLQLHERADAIRFYRAEGGKGKHHFRDIKVTRKQCLTASVESINVGDIKVGQTRVVNVEFDYSDVKGDLAARAENTTNGLTIANNGAIDIECGSFGHYQLPVTIVPTEIGAWENTVYVKDPITNLEISVNLTANILPADELIWNDTTAIPGTNANATINEDYVINGGVTLNKLTVDEDVTVTIENGDVTVGSLTIEEGATVIVKSGNTLTIGDEDIKDEDTYGNLHVEDGAQLILNGSELRLSEFILDATLAGLTDVDDPYSQQNATSGQVSNAALLQIAEAGAVYFDLSFDPSGKISYGWYDFTVPFSVNIVGGISRIQSDDNRVMVSGSDFLIMEADEANRAEGGKGWRNLSDNVLVPGKLYTITFNYQPSFDQNTFRFVWDGNGNLSNGQNYDAQCATGSNADLNGWNGIGNGMLSYGAPSGSYIKQAYNHSTNTYDMVVGSKKFAVGEAFFIQVEGAGAVTWNTSSPTLAPRREARTIDEFLVTLKPENIDFIVDALYVSASEDATGNYTIGHDLVKMGNPKESKKARMWTTRDNLRLCDSELPLIANKAQCPLTFYAPKEEIFELEVEQAPENATLYLTKNGKAIWNLSMSPYELNLEQGTTEGYGLRIVASQQTTTDIENGGLLNDANGVRKVLIDNVIYIVTPEGEMYDLMGKSVNY